MRMPFSTIFSRKKQAFLGLVVLLFSIFLLPLQSYAALEEIKNGTDISTLDIRKFNLNINNFSFAPKFLFENIVGKQMKVSLRKLQQTAHTYRLFAFYQIFPTTDTTIRIYD